MIKTILFLCFISSVISLDVTVCWQVMVSRPIVIGPIIGWLGGDLMMGLIIGALLELVWLNILPLGASIPPDATACTVLATTTAVLSSGIWPKVHDEFIILGIIYAVPLGAMFKKIDILIRRFNTNLAHYADWYAQRGSIFWIENLVRLSTLLVFLKDFLFYFIFISIGIFILPWIGSRLNDTQLQGLEMAQSLLLALGLATVLNTFAFGLKKLTTREK